MKRVQHAAFGCFTLCGIYLSQSKKISYSYGFRNWYWIDCKRCKITQLYKKKLS